MSSYCVRFPGLRRLGTLFLSIALLGAFSVLGPSCSEDKASGGKSSGKSSGGDSSDLADAKAEALKLAKAATKAKVKIYDQKNYKKARTYLAQGKEEDNAGAYRRASKALKRGISTAKKVSKDHRAVKELQEEVEELKDKLEKDGADKNAPDLFTQATGLLDEALDALQEPSAATVRAAGSSLSQAKSLFSDAETVAKENLAYRVQAEAIKASLEEVKAKALAKGADSKAISSWAQAEQQALAADRVLALADFRSAIQSYNLAKQTYIRALEEVSTGEEMAAMLEKQTQEADAYNQQRAAAEQRRLEQQMAVERIRADAERDKWKGLRGGGGEGDTFDPNAETKPTLPAGLNPADYDQGLDEEDEAFLAEHIDQLSKNISYDPETGAIALNYRRGTNLREDLKIDRKSLINTETLRARKYLSFKNEFMEDTSQDITDPLLQQQNVQGPSNFTFSCNTEGSFFLPVPFRWVANVTYAMQILTMDGNGSFNVMMMTNPKRNDGYITDFLKLGKMSNGRQQWLKLPLPEFRGSANYWFEKKRAVWMINEYMRPDPENPEGGIKKSGMMSVTYDAQEAPTINRMPVKSFERGYIGFRWFRVKAELRKLYVTGILDKEEAVKVLRKRLKIKKSKKKKKKKKAKVSSNQSKKEDTVASKKSQTSKDGKRDVGTKDGFDF